jgi:hypothetical protein
MLGVAIQDFAWLDAKRFADDFGFGACEEDACEEQHGSDRHLVDCLLPVRARVPSRFQSSGFRCATDVFNP